MASDGTGSQRGERPQAQRVLGFPVRTGQQSGGGEEPQRVLGFPVDLLGPVENGMPAWLIHPVRECRRWARRRRP